MPKTRDGTVYFISEIYNTLLFVRATCSFCSLLPLYLSMFSLASSHLLSSRRRAHSKCGITSVLSVRVPRVPLLTWCSVRWRDNFRYWCVLRNSRLRRLCTHVMTVIKWEPRHFYATMNSRFEHRGICPKCFLKIINELINDLFHCCVSSE